MAIEAIGKLQSTTPGDAEAQQLYFSQLTDILRTYLHERFGFNAMEMTTREIIEQLQKINDREALLELKNVLQTADLVKFARLSPALPEREDSLLRAVDYVRQTQLPDSDIPQTIKRLVPIEQGAENRKRLACWLGLIASVAALFALLFHLCSTLWLLLF